MVRAPLICAVDDDVALCESLDGLLRSAGFAVRTFSSGSACLQWCANNHADCFILDFAMPEMNGLELRRALLERGITVPVIFATAVALDEVWDRLRSSGAFAVFAKPLDADTLIDSVQRAVTGEHAR